MKRAGEEILSFRRAAVRLGWEDSSASERRLRSMVRATERDCKRAFSVPRGKAGGWGGVTMSGLRKNMPWLFRAGAREITDLERRFKQHLLDMEDRVEGIAAGIIAKTVDPQIDELHGRCARSERRMDAIERQIAANSTRVSAVG